MRTQRIVGIVLGVAGVVITIGHLALMMILRTEEPYHGIGTWVPLGLVLAVIGILLIGKNDNK
jgi:hypothetical protein